MHTFSKASENRMEKKNQHIFSVCLLAISRLFQGSFCFPSFYGKRAVLSNCLYQGSKTQGYLQGKTGCNDNSGKGH